jgi:ribosome-binding protein aMBF1 (putative translation factor)
MMKCKICNAEIEGDGMMIDAGFSDVLACVKCGTNITKKNEQKNQYTPKLNRRKNGD